MVEHLALLDDAITVTRRVVWCAMTTVGADGRPRSRVVHPAWERVDEGLRGWVTTRRSPVKTSHLDTNPFVGCAYVGAEHDVAYFDCRASWSGREERHHAWELFRALPAPAGFDPATIWPEGPDSPGAEVLRLDPYRVQVGLASDLARGAAPRTWRPVASRWA